MIKSPLGNKREQSILGSASVKPGLFPKYRRANLKLENVVGRNFTCACGPVMDHIDVTAGVDSGTDHLPGGIERCAHDSGCRQRWVAPINTRFRQHVGMSRYSFRRRTPAVTFPLAGIFGGRERSAKQYCLWAIARRADRPARALTPPRRCSIGALDKGPKPHVTKSVVANEPHLGKHRISGSFSVSTVPPK